jgi:putative transcriptional regulator
MDDLVNDNLSPGLLIAPPSLKDPNFAESVILLAVHEDSGSMGFIINRQIEITLHQLLGELELPNQVADRAVMLGGPVSGFSGFLLYQHAPDQPLAPGITITNEISLSPSRELLEQASEGGLVDPFELILGYAGWAPGQLEAELQMGSWLHSDLDEDLLFHVPTENKWAEVYSRLGFSPMHVMSVPGGAQA